MVNGAHTKSTKQTTFDDDHEDDDDSNNSYSPDLMSIFIAQIIMKSLRLHCRKESIKVKMIMVYLKQQFADFFFRLERIIS